MRADARETLKKMHTKVVNFLYIYVFALQISRSFSHIHAHIDALFSFLQRRRPFVLFYSLSSLFSCRCVFDLYSQLCVCVCVCRFDDVVNRDDDMTKKEEREKEKPAVVTAAERTRKKNKCTVQRPD
jgi:hypothetical protein